MLRNNIVLAAGALALAACGTLENGARPPSAPKGPMIAETTRHLVFPNAADGRLVLAVDLHTHSVFSDGHVWPTVRTWEAEKDGLAAMAVTEHLEYQPHRDDIPHPDRNRSFALATASAARAGGDLLIIPGAEITRRLPPGHVNAVFITDANPLLTIDRREDDALDNAREALTLARDQGAFVFWNHPAWPRDFPTGVLRVPDVQQVLIDDGLIMGVEVANGQYFSEETLQVVLDNDLVVLGTSDIHGLIDYDYDIVGGEHRTVTLVLAEERTLDGIKDALFAKATVALYDSQYIGRPDDVAAVLSGALELEVGDARRRSMIRTLTVKNNGPVPMTLRNLGEKRFNNSGDIFTVRPHGEIELYLNDSPDPDAVTLPVEVLNSWVAPNEHLRMTLVP